jgi:hypothetical protein
MLIRFIWSLFASVVGDITLSFYNYLLCWKLQYSNVSNEHFINCFFILLVILKFFKLLFCNSLHFSVVKQGLRRAPHMYSFSKTFAKHLMKGQWINDSMIYICSKKDLRIWWNIWHCIICWNEILKIAWLFDKHVLKWPRYYAIYIHSRFRIMLKLNFKLRSFYYLLLNL